MRHSNKNRCKEVEKLQHVTALTCGAKSDSPTVLIFTTVIATRVLHTTKINNQYFSVILSILQGVLKFDYMDESLLFDIFLSIQCEMLV